MRPIENSHRVALRAAHRGRFLRRVRRRKRTTAGPPSGGRALSEGYPYTTLVGARQFAFRPRPPYKRKPRHLTMTQLWPERLKAWQETIERLERLATGDPPLDLSSNPATDGLRTTPVAGRAQAYKKAEDLLDAVLCAWTAALWHPHPEECAVLGRHRPQPTASPRRRSSRQSRQTRSASRAKRHSAGPRLECS